jgi:diguanylate cyclase (GGDEF)-like protein
MGLRHHYALGCQAAQLKKLSDHGRIVFCVEHLLNQLLLLLNKQFQIKHTERRGLTLSIKTKLAFVFSIFVTFILIVTNALYYFSTRDLLITDQEKQAELLAKEISVVVEHTKRGTQYIEDLIGERLRVVSLAAQNELDPDIKNVTNQQLIILSKKLGVSDITLFVQDGDDIKGAKSSDPHEINLSTNQWQYWYTAFQQLFENKKVTIPEGQKLLNYWSGPMNVSASNPDHIDKYGYYFDGSTNYIINPYMRDNQILDFKDKIFGPNVIVNKTLENNKLILSITGFNPKAFGEPPMYINQDGKKFIPLENQEIQFGEYTHQDPGDVPSVKKASKTGVLESFVTTVKGTKVLKTFIPILNDNSYVVGIVIDYKYIQQVLDQQAFNQLMVSLLVLLIVFIGSYFFAGYIVKPLKRILQKVNEFAQGNFDARVAIDRNDELGILASRVNTMAQNIKEYTTELEGKNAEIEYRANYDFLTGLPNRRLFNDQIQTWVGGETSFAVMFIDLDRFKYINDTFGHSAGDDLLKLVAERLLTCLDEGDIIARISGDEFMVAAPKVNAEMAAQKAHRILQQLARSFNYGADELFVTLSVGISLYPDDGDDVETVMKNADIAMYRAKQQGRNCYQFYSSDMDEDIKRKSVLENGLRKALERNELVLFYQPQVDMVSGKIVGTEALLRWQHPELGLILPIEFISLAEETGLIVEIGEWVIRTAAAQNKKWQDQWGVPVTVSVNLSARQFQQKNLVESIMNSLMDAKLDPNFLKLEITESIAMYNEDNVLEKLHALKKSGIKIAIDDFGMGYSSLSYLKKFPIDTLKVDKSFVSDIMIDSDNEEIIKTIIAMARNLRVSVIAEGVETEKQLLFLRELKCDEAQGYLFSKPLPVDQFDAVFLAMQETAIDRVRD